MSTLISSAISGKKAAPKAPVRRRPAAPPTPTPSQTAAKAATPVSASSAPTSVAPPSPPPTQQLEPAAPAPAEPLVATQESSATVEEANAASQPTQGAPTVESESATATQQAGAEGTQDAAETEEELPDLPALSSGKRRRDAEPAPVQEPAQSAPKRVKRSSARSNAQVQAVVQEGETSVSPAAAATPAPKRTTRTSTRKSQAKQTTQPKTRSAPSASDAEAPAPKAMKKSRGKAKVQRKSAATIVDSDAEEEPAEEHEETSSRSRRKQVASKPRKKRRKKISETQQEGEGEERAAGEDGERMDHEDADSSDPELHEIDPNTIQMYSLGQGRDKRLGKTSEREKKMAEIDWAEVARKRREEIEQATVNAEQPPTGDVVESTEGPSGTAASRTTAEEGENNTSQSAAGATAADTGDVVNFRIVNDQIVVDESTLDIDRQARAEAEAQLTVDEPVHEDTDLTRRINRNTFLFDRKRDPADRVPKKRGNDPWGDEGTDRFYEALRMFGTDFDIISKMFVPMTRKQIKHKFTREERLEPERINAALLGKEWPPPLPGTRPTTADGNASVTPSVAPVQKTWDLDFYARETGRDVSEYTKYSSMAEAEAIIRGDMAEREEAMREALRQEEEAEQARKEAAKVRERTRRRAKGAEGGGGGRKRGKGKKGQATFGGGGVGERGGVGGEEEVE